MLSSAFASPGLCIFTKVENEVKEKGKQWGETWKMCSKFISANDT